MTALETAFSEVSPRLSPRPTPLASTLISTAIVGFWIALFSEIFFASGGLAWSVGIAYLAYDTSLSLFVAYQSLVLWRGEPVTPGTPGRRPSVGVIVAAHNEAPVLAATIDALLRQRDPPDQIWLADDGSTDGSASVLAARYALASPELDTLGDPSSIAPTLRWLRLSHRGKALALNAALAYVDTDVVLTVDADTLLDLEAVAVIRGAFTEDPDLVVGGGVLSPRCAGGALARVLQEFQTYEYIRNFLARRAWSQLDCLLLISGAFAAFRTRAVVSVGGFDPECLTEDYELIHRLHRYSVEHDLKWRVRILGHALARTDAPAAILPFLRQRRRWFAGFLQTQYWNRDMTGNSRFGPLGLAMMPVKAIDTLQPFYGLASVVLLIGFFATGRFAALLPASGLVLAKIAFEWLNAVSSVEVYRRWTGDRHGSSLARALLCVLLEPFGFQILRLLGAAWGWIALLSGSVTWGRSSRGADVVRDDRHSGGPTTDALGSKVR